jgi:peptidoglycan/xylan/chitin deacetylase (PgdA/CDA1 family)
MTEAAVRGKSASPSSLRQLALRTLSATMPRRKLLKRGHLASNAVCLTFDDGPHAEYTPELLDVLAQLGVTATFFVIGRNAECNPDIVRRIAAEGHGIGLHSFTHSEPDQTSARRLGDENRRTQEVLRSIVGKSPTLFRPPQGRVTAWKLWSLWRAGLTVVLWNVDPRDYSCASPGQLSDWFQDHPLESGDLVLMHDNHPYAAQALPEHVIAARARGLRFAAINEWVR